MKRAWIAAVALALTTCTASGDSPAERARSNDAPAVETPSSPAPAPAPDGLLPIAGPSLVLEFKDVTQEPFVWVEGELARDCFAGCEGVEERPGSFGLRASKGEPLTAVRTDAGASDRGWSQKLEITGEHVGRIIECLDGPRMEFDDQLVAGDYPDRVVFAVAGPLGAAGYRVWRFEPKTGERLGVSERRGDGERVDARALQVRCNRAGGIRVFSRYTRGESDRLVVELIDGEGRGRSARTLDGALRQTMPAFAVFSERPDVMIGETRERYSFKGGAKGSEKTRDPLRLQPSDGRFTYLLGQRRVEPIELLEHGELVIVATLDQGRDAHVVAFERETGEHRWTAEIGGYDYERRRHATGLALFGRGGGSPPEFMLELKGERLVFYNYGYVDYINVLDPATGEVLVRQLFHLL